VGVGGIKKNDVWGRVGRVKDPEKWGMTSRRVRNEVIRWGNPQFGSRKNES